MIAGKSYHLGSMSSIIRTFLKKHYCKECGTKVERLRVSEFVNAKWARKNMPGTTMRGKFYSKDDEIELIRYKFRCPNCKTEYTIEEMKVLEK